MGITQQINQRVASLIKHTGGKPEWYTTAKQIRDAEEQHGLQWVGGEFCRHDLREPGRLVRSRSGSWGREERGRVVALTARECEAFGIEAGPANIG